MAQRKYKRRKKLIDPGLQLRLTGAFVAMSALSLLLQFLLFAQYLSDAAAALPHDGPVLASGINGLLGKTLLVSFAVLLPVTLAVGILVTFRVAGPLYRFTQFLGSVSRGEHPGECRIRKGDELHEFCALLNRVTEPLRAGQTETRESAEGAAAERQHESVAA